MLKPAEIYHTSERRLGEQDKMRYPVEYEVKRISSSGHLSYRGSNFYLSDVYAGCRVALIENTEGITELHYANLHLGNLEFNSKDRWRPRSLIIKPEETPPEETPRGAKPK